MEENKYRGRFRTNDISYTFQAPTGVPGDITRVDESSVEPAMLIAAGSPPVFAQAYGIPLQYQTGGVSQFVGSEAATVFAGVLVRVAPSIAGTLGSDTVLSPTVPLSTQVQNMLVRGYISVICVTGTPARGGVVYIQVVAAGGFHVGDFRATSDGGNTVALTATQAEWASDGLDANLNAEIRVAR